MLKWQLEYDKCRFHEEILYFKWFVKNDNYLVTVLTNALNRTLGNCIRSFVDIYALQYTSKSKFSLGLKVFKKVKNHHVAFLNPLITWSWVHFLNTKLNESQHKYAIEMMKMIHRSRLLYVISD